MKPNLIVEYYKKHRKSPMMFAKAPKVNLGAVLPIAYKLPPAEAVKYLKKKAASMNITTDWNQLDKDAHQKSFTVAKVMSADVLQEVYDMILKAKNEGMPFDAFKNETVESGLMKRMQDAGWQGKSPGRLQVIYDTNMRLSFAQGRYKQQKTLASIYPYWIYRQVERKSKRLDHQRFDGLKFKSDDKIWETIYPPSAFSCKCTVHAVKSDEGVVNGDNYRKIVSSSNEFNLSPLKTWTPNTSRYVTTLKKQLTQLLLDSKAIPTTETKAKGKPAYFDVEGHLERDEIEKDFPFLKDFQNIVKNWTYPGSRVQQAPEFKYHIMPELAITGIFSAKGEKDYNYLRAGNLPSAISYVVKSYLSGANEGSPVSRFDNLKPTEINSKYSKNFIMAYLVSKMPDELINNRDFGSDPNYELTTELRDGKTARDDGFLNGVNLSFINQAIVIEKIKDVVGDDNSFLDNWETMDNRMLKRTKLLADDKWSDWRKLCVEYFDALVSKEKYDIVIADDSFAKFINGANIITKDEVLSSLTGEPIDSAENMLSKFIKELPKNWEGDNDSLSAINDVFKKVEDELVTKETEFRKNLPFGFDTEFLGGLNPNPLNLYLGSIVNANAKNLRLRNNWKDTRDTAIKYGKPENVIKRFDVKFDNSETKKLLEERARLINLLKNKEIESDSAEINDFIESLKKYRDRMVNKYDDILKDYDKFKTGLENMSGITQGIYGYDQLDKSELGAEILTKELELIKNIINDPLQTDDDMFTPETSYAREQINNVVRNQKIEKAEMILSRLTNQQRKDIEDKINRIKEMLLSNYVPIRRENYETLKLILNSRFKSLHETGTSGGTIADVELRKQVEGKLFSYEVTADRNPIYGAMADKYDIWHTTRTFADYGNVVVEIKKQKLNETTLTFGNSLLYNTLTPFAVDDLHFADMIEDSDLQNIWGVLDSNDIMFEIKRLNWYNELEKNHVNPNLSLTANGWRGKYIECQYHNKLRPEDIKAIHLDSEYPDLEMHNFNELFDKCKELGITIYNKSGLIVDSMSFSRTHNPVEAIADLYSDYLRGAQNVLPEDGDPRLKVLTDGRYNPDGTTFASVPTVVDSEYLENLERTGKYFVCYRGVTAWDEAGANKLYDQFRYGNLFNGAGIYGGGTYAACPRDNSDASARSVAFGYSRFGNGLRFLMPKSARIITDTDLENILRKIRNSSISELPPALAKLKELDRSSRVDDLGHLAVWLGYDAIMVPSAEYIVVLNRSICIVDKNNFNFQ